MVRPATSFDASAIASLFQETMKRAAFGDDRLKRVSDWAGGGSEVARWRARQTSRATFVYEAGGMVRGFAEIEPNGHLDAFCVHADQQRQGIGSALLAEIEVEARRNGVHHLFTETGASARTFFQKRGFKILKPSERNFPNSGEGNVRMSKTLVATR